MDDILEYFIKEPEREFHVRELASLTKKSPTTISKYLRKYQKNKLLISRKKFNHLLFKANMENFSFKDRKLFYNIKKLRESNIIDHLENVFNHPEAIVLFGSYRKAENTKESDIDILIITPLKKHLDLKRYENILGHSIQLLTYSNSDIKKMMSDNKELLNNMLNGIVIYGLWEVFK